jgi:uncharacterized protein YmfQ (DUF2313 family)
VNKTKKKTVTGTDNRSAKIAYCPENEEYKVQFYVGSKKDGTGYYTDDWTDAVDTANAEVNRKRTVLDLARNAAPVYEDTQLNRFKGTHKRSAVLSKCVRTGDYKVNFYTGAKLEEKIFVTDSYKTAIDTATAEVNSEIKPVKKTVEIPGPTWETVTKYIKLVIDKHAKKSWHDGARETVFENLDAMAKVAQISVDVAQKLDLENNELLKPEK